MCQPDKQGTNYRWRMSPERNSTITPSPPSGALQKKAVKYHVIPGCRAAAGPEPIFQRPVFMGSGLAAARRPGMTRLSVQGGP